MNRPVDPQPAEGQPGLDADSAGFFEVLDAQECLELLAAVPVGRLGFTQADEPTILPVTYVHMDRLVVFRTAPDSPLARCAGHRCAFEIDQLDPETGVGWSVLARGMVQQVDPELGAGLRPWAGGPRPLVLGLQIDHVSGRVVSRPEPPSGSGSALDD